MRLHYGIETDSLYIDRSERAGADAKEVEPGVVFDFDREGRLVGIDIQHASTFIDLKQLELEHVPLGSENEVIGNADTGS